MRKLYFVADWKDAVCDLTMREVEDALGQPAPTIAPDPTEGV